MRFSFFLWFFSLVAFVPLSGSTHSRIFGGGQAYYYHLDIENGGKTGAAATYNPFTGCLAGFVLGYEYKKPNDLYAVLQVSYALGRIERESQGTGNDRRFIHDEMAELRVGYDARLNYCGSWFFTPYSGAGFRWNIQYRNPGQLSGLKFDYYKIYIPLGCLLNYLPNRNVNIGLDFEWMPDVLSMASISNINGAFWELERMYNYQVQLPCIFSFCGTWEVIVTPFWIHFWDGASISVTEAGLALDLTKQMTNEWGGRVSLGVRF